MAEYLRLVAEAKVDLALILEREYELAQAPLAYAALREATEKPLGVLLRHPLSYSLPRRPSSWRPGSLCTPGP